MTSELLPYAPTVAGLWAMAALMLVQLLIADVVGIRARHKPGTPVPADHHNALFRVTRTLANSNESVAIFVLAALAGVLLQADPQWLNIGTGMYLAGRVGHMVCYYANWGLARSTTFGLSLIGLAILLFAGARQLPALL